MTIEITLYFMINLFERMLLDTAGIKPRPPDHQFDEHPTEPPRPIGVSGKYFSYFSIKTDIVGSH